MFILSDKVIWILTEINVSKITFERFYSRPSRQIALIEALPIKQGLKLSNTNILDADHLS